MLYLEQIAWDYAYANDTKGFEGRIRFYLETRKLDTPKTWARREVNEVYELFKRQRYNGRRKAEMQSKYWDDIMEFLANTLATLDKEEGWNVHWEEQI